MRPPINSILSLQKELRKDNPNLIKCENIAQRISLQIKRMERQKMTASNFMLEQENANQRGYIRELKKEILQLKQELAQFKYHEE